MAATLVVLASNPSAALDSPCSAEATAPEVAPNVETALDTSTVSDEAGPPPQNETPTPEPASLQAQPAPLEPPPAEPPQPSVFTAEGRYDSPSINASAWASVRVVIDSDGNVNATTAGWVENRIKYSDVLATLVVRLRFSDGSTILMHGITKRSGYGLGCGGVFGWTRDNGSTCAVGDGLQTPPAVHRVSSGSTLTSAEIYPWVGGPFQLMPQFQIGVWINLSR